MLVNKGNFEQGTSSRRLSVCSMHGLRFDARKSAGCVLCVRDRATSTVSGSSKLWYALAVPLAAVVVATAWGALRMTSPSTALRSTALAMHTSVGKTERESSRSANVRTARGPYVTGNETPFSLDPQKEPARHPFSSAGGSPSRVGTSVADAMGRTDIAEVRVLREAAQRARQAPSVAAAECERGVLEACEALRMVYSRGGLEGSSDPERALYYGRKANQLMEAACRTGRPQQCTALAVSLLYSLPKDAGRALALFESICPSNSADVDSCWSAGDAFDANGEPKAKEIAQRFYRRAVALTETLCNGGDGNACLRMGKAYITGAGVASDAERADHFFKMVATK